MTNITDTWGRTITPTLNGDHIDYHVVGPEQDFTQTFPATTPQDVAIACIEASSMPSSQYVAPPPPIPQSVSRYQAMAMMSLTPSPVNAGETLLDDVTAAVTAVGGLTLLAWQNSYTFDRNGVFMLQMADTLALSSAELDALFTAAAQITA